VFADPHVAARGDIETVDDPTIGAVRMQGVYPRFSRTPGAIRGGAPKLGADNEAVYKGLLGLTDAELDGLRREGVI
jgi:crotonobetainyl-CoA:carnitine CoA-transferase CaiB-like acyl-CoA transferase